MSSYIHVLIITYWPNSIVYSYAFLLFWPPLLIIHNPLSSGSCCTVCSHFLMLHWDLHASVCTHICACVHTCSHIADMPAQHV